MNAFLRCLYAKGEMFVVTRAEHVSENASLPWLYTRMWGRGGGGNVLMATRAERSRPCQGGGRAWEEISRENVNG